LKYFYKRISFFIRLIITFGIIFALFKFIPYKKIVEVYKESHKLYLFFSFFIFFCCHLIAVGRWKFLLSSLGIKASLREVFYSSSGGLFFNLFFPSFIAGDVFKGFSISYLHSDVKKVVSSILMGRFSGVITLASVALISFVLGRDVLIEEQVVIPLFILCAIAVFSSLVIFNKSFFSRLIRIFKESSLLRKKLGAFHDQLYFFKNNPNIFVKSLFFSFPIWILTSISFFIASKAFNVQINIVYFLILVPIILAIASVPVAIAGIGTREASAVYFFSLIGIDKSIALSISLINLIFIIFMGIIGGIIYISVYHRWLQSRS